MGNAARSEQSRNQNFHTVTAVARRWDTSTRHVRRLIKRGDLVAHRFGGAQRISGDDLEAYERANREA